MSARLAATITLVFASFVALEAQTNSTIAMSIDTTSSLELKGTSTLHNFECRSRVIKGSVSMDPSESTFVGVNVSIPVKCIQSGSSSMDDNMYDALKADKNPDITFTFAPAVQNSIEKTAHGIHETTLKGTLTIAGKGVPVDLEVKYISRGTDTVQVTGTKDLLMTDFGVEPPTFMFGALKTGNKVTVDFDLRLSPLKSNVVTTSMK